MLQQLIKTIWPTARRDSQRLVRAMASRAAGRAVLNAAYRPLSFYAKSVVHYNYSGVFHEPSRPVAAGNWRMRFAGRPVQVPLRPESIDLDWTTALSVLGHDYEVKQTYANLVRSPQRPDRFIDIGTNFGTHSLLFLVQGIDTLSVEPNSVCQDYFRRLCAANGVTPQIAPVALGEQAGSVEFWYPPEQTWLGTTDAATRERIGTQTADVVRQTIEQTTLDALLGPPRKERLLVKIDVEGSELAVLRGARQTLAEVRPWIIFECWQNEARAEIYEFFGDDSYRLAQLPWTGKTRCEPLDLSAFQAHRATNFLALPEEAR